jgi:predicted Zn-dependent protease with MMP-like domain
MIITHEQFTKLVAVTIENLPKKFQTKLNNVAIFVEDYASEEQLKKVHLKNKNTLFGLFEGYGQSKKLNFGPVLQDRITIFRIPICLNHNTEEACAKQIESTVRHEIAHHFGSDEKGAAKAGRGKT